MKKPATVVILALALLVGIALLAKPSFLPQSSPARRPFRGPEDDLDEFVGRVKSCTVETEEHEFTTHFMDSENRYKRKPFKTAQFDREGRKIEEVHYRRDGVALPKTTYIYDKNGVLLKENHYSAITEKPHAQAIYSYDQLGRLKEKIGKDLKDNHVYSRTVFTYDLRDNYLEVTDYDSTRMLGKIGAKLDSQGRMTEVVSLIPGNTLGKVTASFDEKGLTTEVVVSSSDGSPLEKKKYTFDFDGQGNWVKKTLYQLATEDGKSFDKLMNITYRVITYY